MNTLPFILDTHHDGLPDYEDPYPLEWDHDGDGYPDGQEPDEGTNMNNDDSDGDGLTDGDKVNIYHTDPNNPNSDGDEVLTYYTNPNDSDTDGDSLSDVDVEKGNSGNK